MEARGLLRGSVILLLLSLGRLLLTGDPAPPLPSDGEGNDLPGLLEEARELRSEEARRSRPLEEEETLDPNRAQEAELDRLPGVGPSLAAAIVRHREERGGFRSSEDLLAVPGIGPATLDRIRTHLDFSRGVPLDLRAPAEGTRRRVDVNRAGLEELQSLPGIGPALAQRILDSRSRDGPFRRLDDLLRVRGIGPATLARLQPLVQTR
jgi:competence protein ComEA